MRDRDLVRLYWPVELRPAFDALFDIDEAMGDVVARATQPALAAIKLAWWRERLEGLDGGEVPAEPRLVAAARELLPRGIGGAELAELEAGWVALLHEKPEKDMALARGETLFRLAARLLHGEAPAAVVSVGRWHAGGNLVRRGILKDVSLRAAGEERIPPRFRPLTGLAALGCRDFHRQEAEATPTRAWALLRHRLTGRIG